MVNLSSFVLSEEQLKVLSLGLNFAVSSTSVLKEDIIVRTEQIAGMMKEGGQTTQGRREQMSSKECHS